ncbi:hypothetical protein ACFT2C_23960, partial [Promicromonospora sp. NPDC057138]|uniref:hypothetical protein n=1 Tax=Promicromonospora sp. NPDC057138 TaxID=3346031 RepID=UPI00362618C4
MKHAAPKKKTASAGARTIATVAIATAATSMAAPAMAAEASPLDSLGDLGTTAEGLTQGLPALSSTSIDLSELTDAVPVVDAVTEQLPASIEPTTALAPNYKPAQFVSGAVQGVAPQVVSNVVAGVTNGSALAG